MIEKTKWRNTISIVQKPLIAKQDECVCWGWGGGGGEEGGIQVHHWECTKIKS